MGTTCRFTEEQMGYIIQTTEYYTASKMMDRQYDTCYNMDKFEYIIHLRKYIVSNSGQMAEVPVNISKWTWRLGQILPASFSPYLLQCLPCCRIPPAPYPILSCPWAELPSASLLFSM